MIVSEASATAEEARIIHDLVSESVENAAKRGRLPKQVHPDFRLEFGEDSAGDPAVWIWFLVDNDRPSQEETKQAVDLTDDIQNAVLQSPARHWPYVKYSGSK